MYRCFIQRFTSLPLGSDTLDNYVNLTAFLPTDSLLIDTSWHTAGNMKGCHHNQEADKPISSAKGGPELTLKPQAWLLI